MRAWRTPAMLAAHMRFPRVVATIFLVYLAVEPLTRKCDLRLWGAADCSVNCRGSRDPADRSDIERDRTQQALPRRLSAENYGRERQHCRRRAAESRPDRRFTTPLSRGIS